MSFDLNFEHPGQIHLSPRDAAAMPPIDQAALVTQIDIATKRGVDVKIVDTIDGGLLITWPAPTMRL